MDNTIDLKAELAKKDELIAKLQQQLEQQSIVIAAIQKKSRIWLLPWTMPPKEVAQFAEQNRKTFGAHCLCIPSSCVKAPQLMEISRADEDEVRESIRDSNKCYNAILNNLKNQALSHNQQEKLKRVMAQQQPIQPLQPSKFDSGAIEIPSFKKDGHVFSLPTFDKKKRVFTLPDGSSPGAQF